MQNRTNLANFVSMVNRKGVLKFEYRGKLKEIPYSAVLWGGENRLHLTDKKRCVHIVYFQYGKWVPLWSEKFSQEFMDVLDFVIKMELGNK